MLAASSRRSVGRDLTDQERTGVCGSVGGCPALGSEILRRSGVNTETHDLPSILGMLAQQKLVIGILTLETVPQRFGIDSAHPDSIADAISVFTQRARRIPAASNRYG